MSAQHPSSSSPDHNARVLQLMSANATLHAQYNEMVARADAAAVSAAATASLEAERDAWRVRATAAEASLTSLKARLDAAVSTVTDLRASLDATAAREADLQGQIDAALAAGAAAVARADAERERNSTVAERAVAAYEARRAEVGAGATSRSRVEGAEGSLLLLQGVEARHSHSVVGNNSTSQMMSRTHLSGNTSWRQKVLLECSRLDQVAAGSRSVTNNQ